jgi:hypothetical protein
MKIKSKIHFLVAFLLAINSCNTQRLVLKVNDAKKLETNKDNYIGKPLKEVLSEIKPKIKFVYGNPENTWAGAIGGTYFTFYFADNEDGKKRISVNDIPTQITIRFQLEKQNNKKTLPKEGLTIWTEKETKEYGDMIIQNIYVSGEN